jgi:hypothetical protein
MKVNVNKTKIMVFGFGKLRQNPVVWLWYEMHDLALVYILNTILYILPFMLLSNNLWKRPSLHTLSKAFSKSGKAVPFLFSICLNDLEECLLTKDIVGLKSITDELETELEIYRNLFVMLYAICEKDHLSILFQRLFQNQ